MTLDPQVADFLTSLGPAANADPGEISVAQLRLQMKQTLGTLGTPPDVHRVEDRQAPGPAGPIRLRIYTPTADAPAAAVVYFHGGGWVVGNLDTHDGLCRRLALASGCRVVAVDYRLAPENTYPAAADDAYAALSWVAENADQLGIDPRRIAVAGDSAGGNLAAVTALAARDRKGPLPAAQVLMYPITDSDFETGSYRDFAEGYMLTTAAMRWFWDQYAAAASDRIAPYAAPLRADGLAGLPPALVITAEYDPLRDEGEAYAGRLEGAGVPVELVRYDGMIHGFIRRTETFARAGVAIEKIGKSLKTMLRGG